MTWGDFSMTARAARIGFFTTVTPATAPAQWSFPSMIEASSSFFPSWVNTAPLPALNSGESSRTTTAASTTSGPCRPACQAQPARRAACRSRRYAASNSGVSPFLKGAPPP